MDDLYLMHHGIKGMHWGVRRFEDANGHLTPAGKRRYAVQDARKYYKINRLQRAREKNRDPDKNEQLAKRIRRVQTRSDRKHADLTQQDINIGREIVSKNRRNWAMIGTAAKAAATAAGAYALYQNPKTRALAPLAIAGGAALTYGSAKKVPYYTMEARRYKQVNPKGATNRGLTKRQQTLRKLGKTAVGVALAGATGYALYKTGAGKAVINAGRNALEARTGINVEKNPGKDSVKNLISDTPSKIRDAKSVSSKKRSIRDAISDTGAAAKDKVKNSIRNQILGDIDEDDPSTWLNPIRNTKNTVQRISRYGRALNDLRKGNTIDAVAGVSEDINDITNNIIDGTRKRINGARDRRKSK